MRTVVGAQVLRRQRLDDWGEAVSLLERRDGGPPARGERQRLGQAHAEGAGDKHAELLGGDVGEAAAEEHL